MTNMLKVIVEKVGHVGDYKAEQINSMERWKQYKRVR